MNKKTLSKFGAATLLIGLVVAGYIVINQMTHDKARAAVAAPAIPVTVGTAEKKDVPIALAILAVLVVAGLLLVDRLRSVSALQDCLMTRATHCAEIDPSAPPATSR